MKGFLACVMIAGVLATGNARAQWTVQASPVKNNLTAVAFRGNQLGYAVGEEGVILLTRDGGKKWEQLKSPVKENLTSVTILDSKTVMITSNRSSGDAAVYESKDQGRSWVRVLTDSRGFIGTRSPDKSLYTASSHVFKSGDNGKHWDTGQSLNLTTTYSRIQFADASTGIIGGNISGVLTYSTELTRTADSGKTWYDLDNFSYPNANGYAAMSMVNSDSVFLFTNYYNRYLPGDSCQLILLTNFRLVRILGLKSWKFDYRIINQSFADRVSDCRFFSSGRAYTIGDKGIIYTSNKYGNRWKTDYEGKVPLNAIFMNDELNGFAVGDGGLILKRTAGKAAVAAPLQVDMKLYPNPAAAQAYAEFNLPKDMNIAINISDAQGNVRSQVSPRNYNKGLQKVTIPAGKLQNGVYHVQLVSNGQLLASKEMVIMH